MLDFTNLSSLAVQILLPVAAFTSVAAGAAVIKLKIRGRSYIAAAAPKWKSRVERLCLSLSLSFFFFIYINFPRPRTVPGLDHRTRSETACDAMRSAYGGHDDDRMTRVGYLITIYITRRFKRHGGGGDATGVTNVINYSNIMSYAIGSARERVRVPCVSPTGTERFVTTSRLLLVRGALSSSATHTALVLAFGGGGGGGTSRSGSSSYVAIAKCACARALPRSQRVVTATVPPAEPGVTRIDIIILTCSNTI